jgi:hypothetical protein
MKPNVLPKAIVRFVMITGFVIAVGFIVYKYAVFIPTMPQFQFFINGITLGLAYTTFKSNISRYGYGILFLWYFILSGFITTYILWMFMLNAISIIAMTAAIYSYFLLIKKQFVNILFTRIISSAVLIGIANGLIVLFLGIISFHTVVSQPMIFLGSIYYNLKIGTVMGIVTGTSIEFVEYFLIKIFIREQVAS